MTRQSQYAHHGGYDNDNCTYLYGGWNMVQETIATTTSTTTNHYIWGKDLSGTLQGAGGVGGLLAVYSPLPLGEGQGEGSMFLPCYDNNGNITARGAERQVPV